MPSPALPRAVLPLSVACHAPNLSNSRERPAFGAASCPIGKTQSSDHMNTPQEPPKRRHASTAAATATKTQPAEFVAVLDPVPFKRARTRRLLAGLGLPTLGFDRSAELSAKLASGDRFAMLVVAFECGSSIARARAELDHLVECVGPEVPIMLLMSHEQVDLAADVMGSDYYDFMIGPFSDEELLTRLGLLYLNWSRQVNVGLARRMQGFIESRLGDESRPLPL